MIGQEKKERLTIFTRLGLIVIRRLWVLIVVGVFLLLLDDLHLKTNCKNNPKCDYLTPTTGNIGTTLLQSAIVIWFVDIGLKREISKENEKVIKEIVKEGQEKTDQLIKALQFSEYISTFSNSQERFNNYIVKDINESYSSVEDIQILGFFEEINVVRELSRKIIKRKVIAGCNIRILILHPQSSLVESLNRSGYEDSSVTIDLCKKRLEALCRELDIARQKENLQGSLEIRLHRDLYPPFCYYSNQSSKLVWIYLSNPNGTKFPGFSIVNKELIRDIEQHFDHLWTRSSTQVLIEIKRERVSNNFQILQE